MRSICLVLLLLSCSYKGPKIEDLVPSDRDMTLAGERIGGEQFDTMIVYGDSLSDPGNLSDNSFHILLPHEIFYKGRFSNGPVWADYVEKATAWTVYNYAVSGARTHTGPFPERLIVTDFPEQIEESRSRLAKLNTNRSLIAIWIGPNNYLRNGGEYEDERGRTKKSLLQKGVERSLSEIKNGVEGLIKQGFKSYVLGKMPELGGINRNPRGGRTATDATLFEATRLHNEGLRRIIKELEAQHGEVRIATFQAYEINRATYEDPKAYGFTELKKPCFEGSLTGDFYGEEGFCSDLLGYKFWEYLHPNTMMHCYYASQFLLDAAEADFIGPLSRESLLDRCRSLNDNEAGASRSIGG